MGRIAEVGDAVIYSMKRYVNEAMEDVNKKFAALQMKEGPKGEKGDDGKDVDPTLLGQELSAMASEVVEGLK